MLRTTNFLFGFAVHSGSRENFSTERKHMYIKNIVSALVFAFAVSSTTQLYAYDGEFKSGNTTLPNGCSFYWSLRETGIGGSSHHGYCEIIMGAGCNTIQTKLYYSRSDRNNVVYGRDGYRRSSAVTVQRTKRNNKLTDARSCDFNATGSNDSTAWGFNVKF